MAVFELGGALASALPELEVGPWTSASPGLTAFDADTARPEALWRVHLARDDAASRAALADGERCVARTHAALDDVPRRLDLLAELVRSAGPGPGRGARGPGLAPALPRIEASLLAALAGVEADLPLEPELPPSWAVGPVGPAGVSRFAAPAGLEADLPLEPELPPPWAVGPVGPAGVSRFAAPAGVEVDLALRPELPPSWAAGARGAAGSPGVVSSPAPAIGRLERALVRVGDLARGRARIETHVEGALVACSVTTLSGDTELRIARGLSMTDARLHARSVAVAVRTRHAWARVLALVVSSGSRLFALGLPAGGVSAVPLVWRFLRDVLREVRYLTAAPRPAA